MQRRDKVRISKNNGIPPKKTLKRFINTTRHNRSTRPSGRKENTPFPAIKSELKAAKWWASKAFWNVATKD